MTTAQAWATLAQELAQLDPKEVAERSGALWDGGRLRLPFFDRAFLIGFPDMVIAEEGRDAEPSAWLKLMLGRYLASAKDLPFSGDYLGFRQLPESASLQAGFAGVVTEPLRRLYGADLEGFHRACQARGGQPVPGLGDATYRFLAFPRTDLVILLYLGEDNLPPSLNILFDSTDQYQLGAEDHFILGEYLSASLRNDPGHYLLK